MLWRRRSDDVNLAGTPRTSEGRRAWGPGTIAHGPMSEAADPLADQRDADDQEQDGHDGGVVVDEPGARDSRGRPSARRRPGRRSRARRRWSGDHREDRSRAIRPRGREADVATPMGRPPPPSAGSSGSARREGSRARARTAVIESMAAIHFGSAGSVPGSGRERHCRTASSSSSSRGRS